MTFYTGPWGFMWLCALIVAAAITIVGDGQSHKRGLAVITASWVVTRLLVSNNIEATLPFNLNDAAAFILLVLYARADALAVLYFMIFQVGVMGSLGLINGDQSNAMADLLGFVALFCMAGGAHFDGRGLENRAGLTGLGDRLRGVALGKWA